MRLARILDLVNNGVWAIKPETHKAIRKVLSEYLDAKAFSPADFTQDDSPAFEVVGNTAIIPIEGVILNKCSGLEAACGAFSLDTFKQSLKAVGAMPDVANVILNISSGGGIITGVPEAAQAIKALGKTKNVIAYTDSLCASAAYWLACNCSQVFLSESAEMGSIGVYNAFIDESAAYAQEGLKVEVFKTGTFKAMGIEGLSLTDEQRAYIQEGVDNAFAQFTATVKANRPKVKADVFSAKMYSASDAKRMGLADGVINSLDDLVDYLNK